MRLSGWLHRKRDHGQLLFLDLRDHYGLTQCVVDTSAPHFEALSALRLESVIRVTGPVVARSAETANPKLPTGSVEVRIEEFDVLSDADPIPIPVNAEHNYPEDMRLRYRFLDLRREKAHEAIMLRSRVVDSIRRHMVAQGFTEFQTPILTSSSPEGARDFLVPSRLHPGRFYALPQAPQQFKQLLMVAGFDRYFQIAPCFRDEDSRKDRSPGEFYQLDLEMSFVEQEDVFRAVEPVLHGVYAEFVSGAVSPLPWPRIPFAEAMLKYGSDKPDLRNPLVIADVTGAFRGSGFALFANAVVKGSVVRAIPAPGSADRSRSFFDKMGEWARAEGWPGLGWISFAASEAKGPIARNLSADRLESIRTATGLGPGDAMFFACDAPERAAKLAGMARSRLGEELGLIEQSAFRFCWIVDFPMYERDDESGGVKFCHNPFSMPQGGLEALTTKAPIEILAHQYDIVCNGVEIGSGAIRNHRPDIMFKAFEIVGYDRAHVERAFGAMLNAFRYGAPPHGGIAPGIDRIVMQIGDLENIREGIAFPMNQQAEDLMMGAPSVVSARQLKELHIKVALPEPESAAAVAPKEPRRA